MSAVRKLYEDFQKNPQEPASLIESLRAFHHSIHAAERSHAIEVLGGLRDPEAARELIQIFNECQWRSTKIQVLKALSKFPTQRSLEFLFRIAQEEKDVPLAEIAVRALGHSHHILAARFLVHLYENGPALLKPYIIGALGNIPDRTLAEDLLKELPLAIETNQMLLVKNLVLTLGELKVKEALPVLDCLALRKEHPQMAHSALMSIGKIARDVRILDRLEHVYKDDLFEYQIFTTARNQVQMRSQWKLEDYLQKLFESPVFHPNLPFELGHFDADDVKEGFKLYNSPQHFVRLCYALSRVHFPEIQKWYEELLNLKELASDQLAQALESLASHYSEECADLVMSLQKKAFAAAKSPVFDKWLEALSLTSPKADERFKNLVETEDYANLPDEQRIRLINHWVNFGLSIQCDTKRALALCKNLESMLEREKSKAVQARLMRAIGQIGQPGNKIMSFIREHIKEPLLTPSCLYFLELCPQAQNAQLITSLFPELKHKSSFAVAALKALAVCQELPTSKELEDFFKACLGSDAAIETQNHALQLLARHPLKSLQPLAAKHLKSHPRVQLAAVITLKSFNDEAAVEALEPCLTSPSESIRGRALDTLTGLPGNRAKRLVIDFLKENSQDAEIVDKIVRCMTPPTGPSEYFVSAVEQILAKHPNHPHLEGLTDLRTRMGQNISEGSSLRIPPDANIAKIDRELSQKLKYYAQYDESAKSALRSAEVPFHRPEIFDQFVDKSAAVLGFCKAVDIILEKHFGRRHLFPRLEQHLHEFQNAAHAASLNDDYPSGERVLERLSLEKHFTVQSLPLHKMSMVAQGILNSKIVHEHFKIIDGLRAWAVVLLLFGRKTPKTLINLPQASDEQIVTLAKKLMNLQDLRNPVAHRQTLLDFKTADQVRQEVMLVLKSLEALLF